MIARDCQPPRISAPLTTTPARDLAAPLMLLILAASLPVHAQEPPDPLADAILDMHHTDADGQLFSFSIAMAGVVPGLTVGSIAIIEGEWLGLESGDAFAQAASLGLLATSAGVIVHGLMRIAERQAGAAASARLLAHPELLRSGRASELSRRGTSARFTLLHGGVPTLVPCAGRRRLGVA
ncbi:MAG: hypothetical protein AAGF12_35480, partial [Myxococcota bacterium]